MRVSREWHWLAAGLCLCAGLRASSVVALSQDQLIDTADWIVHGVVLSSESAYRGGAMAVFTDVTVEVTEVLKGTWEQPILHVALPGGELDGRTISVAGTPHFTPGEEICVFLRDLGNGERTTVGLAQGKLRIVPDPATGVAMVVPDQTALNRVPPRVPNQTAAQALTASASSVRDWGSLRRHIRSRVAGGTR